MGLGNGARQAAGHIQRFGHGSWCCWGWSVKHGEGSGVFVSKLFVSFQIPPLGTSPGSSLGHTGQAEGGCGHAALSSKAEVRGTERRPGEGGTMGFWCPCVGGTPSGGSSGHGGGKTCPLCSPRGGWLGF